MIQRNAEFLHLYQRHRYQNQSDFYRGRLARFERARRQGILLTVLLASLTSAMALLASANIAGLQPLWSFLAVIFPAMSTALAAYLGLYAFERQAKLYRDAGNALLAAHADAPEAAALESSEGARALAKYVTGIEAILRNENSQWGQLTGEIEPVEPPAVTPRAGN